MSKIIFANKQFDSHPYFTPVQCKEIVIAALLSDQIKPENVIIGITDMGFKAFDKLKVRIVQPSTAFPDTSDSFDLIDGRAFLTVQFSKDLTEIEIFKVEGYLHDTGFNIARGRLRINDRLLIDSLVSLFETIVLKK